MRITRRHYTTKSNAIVKIDGIDIKEIVNGNLPKGIAVTETKKIWVDEEKLSFSLTVKAGLIKKTITGTVRVDESLISIDLVLPRITVSFIPLNKIEGDIEHQLKMLFPKD